MKRILLVLTMVAGMTALAKNHVAFVNVGGAIDDRLFANTITNELVNIVQLNYAIEKMPSVSVADLVTQASKGYPKGERQICVYFVADSALPPQVNVPGFFSVINVRGLQKDADAQKYATRIKKMVLKGLAFSCGFGANQDVGRCVMGAGSFETLKGIDSTSASYSPFCYFPLSDYLQARGLLDETPAALEE